MPLSLAVYDLSHGFRSVAGLAEGLPIVHVPEKFLVAAMWNDMINDLRRDDAPIILTCSAQRIAAQVRSACLLPARVVAALACSPASFFEAGSPLLLRLCGMVRAVSLCGQLGTAWSIAWMRRSVRHGVLLNNC